MILLLEILQWLVNVTTKIRAYCKNRKIEQAKNDNNQYYVDAEGNKNLYEEIENEE
ncbi:MAG: hypothetical protein PHF76_11220 [Bacteroidales bacterium]|nr:hypothetical protein [Bacteroidales bacterium]